MKDPVYRKFYAALMYKIESDYNGKQTECGKAAGIAKSYMSQICNGSRKPSFKKRSALCDIFGMEYEDFLNFGEQLLTKGKVERISKFKEDTVIAQILPMLEILKNNDIVGFSEIVGMINEKTKEGTPEHRNGTTGEL